MRNSILLAPLALLAAACATQGGGAGASATTTANAAEDPDGEPYAGDPVDDSEIIPESIPESVEETDLVLPPVFKVYSNPAGERASAIAAARDGGAFIGGATHHASSPLSDFVVLRVDSSGAIMWRKQIDRSDFDYVKAIAAVADGGVFAAGYRDDGTGATLPWIAKLNELGDIEWEYVHPGPAGSSGAQSTAGAFAIIETPDGGAYACGVQLSSIDPNDRPEGVLVMRLSASGALIWARNYYDAPHQHCSAMRNAASYSQG